MKVRAILQEVTQIQATNDARDLGLTPHNVHIIEGGIENTVFAVHQEKCSYIAKYYTKPVSLIEEELKILEIIDRSQVHIARPITIDGVTLHRSKCGSFVYYEHIDGSHKENLSEDEILKLFLQISSLHKQTSHFQASNTLLPSSTIEVFEEISISCEKSKKFTSELKKVIVHNIDINSPSPYGLIHGDLVPSNVIFSQLEPVFIDFDDAHNDFLAVDYIASIKHLLLSGNREEFFRYLSLAENFLNAKIDKKMITYTFSKFAAVLFWGDHIKNRNFQNYEDAILHLRVIQYV